MRTSISQKGFSTVELLIAVAILVAVTITVSASLQTFVQLSVHTAQTVRAGLLLEEGAEAVQILRDQDWDTTIGAVPDDTPYYLYWNGSDYVLTGTSTVIDGAFIREVVFSEIARDGSGVLDSSGTADTDSRRVTITIYRASDSTVLATAESLIHNSYE